MQITNRLQCPNCGATSSFKELAPSRFECAYCCSQFEHQSTVLDTNADTVFYDQFLNIFTDLKKLTPDRAKYTERMFTGCLTLHEYALMVKDEHTHKKLFEKLSTLVDKAMVGLHIKDSQKHIKNLTQTEVAEHGLEWFYVSNYNRILAMNRARFNSPEMLNLAEQNIENAIVINYKISGPYDVNLIRCKVGVLLRQGKKEEAFDYLDRLLLDQADIVIDDKEQLKYDFEDIFLSGDYLDYSKM